MINVLLKGQYNFIVRFSIKLTISKLVLDDLMQNAMVADTLLKSTNITKLKIGYIPFEESLNQLFDQTPI